MDVAKSVLSSCLIPSLSLIIFKACVSLSLLCRTCITLSGFPSELLKVSFALSLVSFSHSCHQVSCFNYAVYFLFAIFKVLVCLWSYFWWCNKAVAFSSSLCVQWVLHLPATQHTMTRSGFEQQTQPHIRRQKNEKAVKSQWHGKIGGRETARPGMWGSFKPLFPRFKHGVWRVIFVIII